MSKNSVFIRTNSKIYKERIYKYLLESINFEDVEEELTDRQKIEYFFAEFESIANHKFNLRKFPNDQDRLRDHIQGAPSNLNIAFTNFDILELVKDLHKMEDLTEKQENTVLENYFTHIAFQLMCLKNKLSK